MSLNPIKNAFFCALLFAFLVFQTGCLALNIPSERLAEPTDGGGILGGWKHNHTRQSSTHIAHIFSGLGHDPKSHDFEDPSGNVPCDPSFESTPGNSAGMSHDDHSIDGGSLGVDPFDTSVDQDGSLKAPEVPWPRFHPIPTRPVFGGKP